MPRRYRELFISPVQAARGAPLELETPTGRIRLQVPKGTVSGRIVRVKDAGKKRLLGGRRDLYLRLWVLNSLLELERPRQIDGETLEELDFVLRYVRRGVIGDGSAPVAYRRLDVRGLYTDYLVHGDPERLQAVLADSVGQEPVPVEFSDWLTVPGMVQMSAAPPRSGVPELPSPRRIFVAAALKADPLAVGAVLAHESAHAFLYRRGYYQALNPRTGAEKEQPRKLDRRDERLTDLSVFGLGWGDLTLNALRRRGDRWWALGYLDAATIHLAAWRSRELFGGHT